MPEKTKSHKTALGLGMAALAAAAGAYFLYGNDAAKNRKKVQSWALKVKAEVLERLENVQKLSKEEYRTIVDEVTRKYYGVKTIDPAELETLKNELKEHWKRIAAHINEASAK